MGAGSEVGNVESTMRKIIRRFIFSLYGLLALALSNVLLAQNYDNPGLGELPVYSHPQDFKPLGIRAGGFMLHPGIQLATEWSDNVFYTAENEINDTIFHFRPYITAQSNWSKHSFNIRLAADIARYKDRDILDYEDYFVLINGQVDVRNRSFFTYNVDWMNLHESRNNRSAEQGIEPNRGAEFRLQLAAGGAKRGTGEVTVRFADGSSSLVANVALPRQEAVGDKYVALIGLGAIFAVWLTVRAVRNRRAGAQSASTDHG